ncbi:MAG: hypothetical protein FJ297_15865 [Planctomycetes bacterium]|nr:hypothetical protein [Planctomycetota bacterium]
MANARALSRASSMGRRITAVIAVTAVVLVTGIRFAHSVGTEPSSVDGSVVQAQAIADAPEIHSPIAASGADGRPEVAAIAGLRRLFGDPLAGTSLGESGPSDFARAVAALAESRGILELPVSDAPATTGASAPVEDRPTPPVGPIVEPERVVCREPTVPDRSPTTPGEIVALEDIVTIRSNARQLDRSAADLEDLGLYDDADELRAMAMRLRESVRGFDVAARRAANRAVRQALRQAD